MSSPTKYEIRSAIAILSDESNIGNGLNESLLAAHKTALEVLQDAETREKGCEVCNSHRKCGICVWRDSCSGTFNTAKEVCTSRVYTFKPMRFCRECGKPIAEELLKTREDYMRWEATREEK